MKMRPPGSILGFVALFSCMMRLASCSESYGKWRHLQTVSPDACEDEEESNIESNVLVECTGFPNDVTDDERQSFEQGYVDSYNGLPESTCDNGGFNRVDTARIVLDVDPGFARFRGRRELQRSSRRFTYRLIVNGRSRGSRPDRLYDDAVARKLHDLLTRSDNRDSIHENGSESTEIGHHRRLSLRRESNLLPADNLMGDLENDQEDSSIRFLQESSSSECVCQAPSTLNHSIAFNEAVQELQDDGALSSIETVESITELEEVDCDGEISPFESEILIEHQGNPGSVTDGEIDAISQGFIDTYNELNALNSGTCDPFFRVCDQVEIVRSEGSTRNLGRNLQQRFTWRYLTRGRCRGCPSRTRSFDEGNRRRSLVTSPVFGRDLQDEEMCFCAPNAEERPPTEGEFESAFDETIQFLQEDGLVENVLSVEDVNDVTEDQLTQAEPLSISVESGSGCLDDSNFPDISIDVTVTGGRPPYSFSWSVSGDEIIATTEDLDVVPDGTYTLEVTDSESSSASITVGPYDCCGLEATCNSIDSRVDCSDGDSLLEPLDQDVVFTFDSDVACGELRFVFTEERTAEDCADEETITYTYTLFDDLDGDGELDGGEESLDCTQTISVRDNDAPELSGVPDDEVVEFCNVTHAASVSVSDNCDPDPDVTFDEERIDGNCPDDYILIRTWTATDRCGNDRSESQEILVEDREPPVFFEAPEDVTVSCDDVPDGETLVATDKYDPDPVITLNEEVTDLDCPDDYVLVRTWTATDRCGNENSTSQEITVRDTEPPVLSGVPDDLTVECDNLPAPANPTATDNCDPNPNINLVEELIDVSGSDTPVLVRTWTATDRCGNEASQSQEIIVSDIEPPVISGVPSDEFVTCDNVPDPSEDVRASDNSDPNPTITFTETRTDGDCPDDYVLFRNWTATDSCGNEETESQEIAVGDTEAPVLSGVPDDVTVECGNNIPPVPDTITATDNCDPDPQITFVVERIDGDCPDEFELVRSWTATDRCGNEETETQVITVRDTTAPEFDNCPGSIAIDICTDQIPGGRTVTAADNCGRTVEVIGPDCCFDGDGITRTWTATDQCGNQATACEQEIEFDTSSCGSCSTC